MSIEETIKKMLSERGLLEDQCDAILARMKAHPANKALQGRWHNKSEDCPQIIMSLAWLSARKEALAYIDENCPEAWCRPMFASAEGDAG